MARQCEWTENDAKRAVGYRRKGYSFVAVGRAIGYSGDQAKLMIESLAPELLERVPQEDSFKAQGWGDLWDDRSDYLVPELIRPEVVARLERVKAGREK